MRKINSPRRVLIYRLGSLGDTVVAVPALRLVERAFPNADRRMLASFPPNVKAPASSAILNGTDLVSGYFRYTYKTRSIRELATLWWKLVKWRPDVFIYLNEGRGLKSLMRDEVFFRLCGVRRFIGMPYSEDLQTCRAVSNADTDLPLLKEYEAQRLVRNLAEIGKLDLDDPASWDLKLSSEETARADAVLQPLNGGRFLAVSLGTKKQSSDWERENWRELLSRLGSNYPGHGLVLCGAVEEREVSGFASDGWRETSRMPALNLCGELSPRESAAVFQQAELFIGHDSGPGHLAAAVQTPCVSIFGSHCLPGIWFPYGKRNRILYHLVDCAGCKLLTCVEQHKKCILSISVDEVMAQIAIVVQPKGPFNLMSS